MTRILPVGVLLSLLITAVLFVSVCGSEETRPESVHGRMTDVKARSITEADMFSLLDSEGETWSFVAEGPLEFTPSHLREHMLTGEEVTVRFRRVGEVLIAVGVADYP